MATPSGLGVSTGIGTGEAQVFAPVKNDYYKNKANLALKEKDKQEKAFIDIGSAPVFNPDTEEYKQELAKVRQFYRDNQRSILEGDFDTKLKLNQLTSGLTQWAANSNAQGKLWTDLKKKAGSGETKFYQKDLDNLTKYYNTPFSQRQGMQIGLRDAFDKQAFLDDGVERVKDLPFYDEGFQLKSMKDSSGNLTDMIINKSGQSVDSVDAIVDAMIESSYEGFTQEQVDASTTRDETRDYLKKFIAQKSSNKILGKGNVFNINTGKQDSVSSFVFNGDPNIAKMNEVYGAKDKDKKGLMGYNSGDVTVFNEIALNKTHNFKGTIPPGAIPLDMSYAYNTFPTPGGAAVTNEGFAQSGKIFNINDARDGIQKDSKWTIMSSSIVEAYPDGFKTQDTDDKRYGANDISGFPIGKKSKDTDRFKGKKVEHRYYARMKDDIGGVILVPYNTVRESVNQKLTKEEKKNMRIFEEDTKAFLIEKGWSKAYKDFTGKKMPGSGNNSKTTTPAPTAKAAVTETAAQMALRLSKNK